MRPSAWWRILAWTPFVVSAALAATVLHWGATSPLVALLLLVAGLGLFWPRIRARRRARDLLVSGDVERIFDVWQSALHGIPHRETMGPIIAATALAANGMLERARSVLERAGRGPAWDAALEHRLFVETLLDAFEGDRDVAVQKALLLSSLPLPVASAAVCERVRELRRAAVALARAFGRRADAADAELLHSAARTNPLVHWALRYAAAVAYLDHDRPDAARRELEGAPRWPVESAFCAFHAEISERAATVSQSHA